MPETHVTIIAGRPKGVTFESDRLSITIDRLRRSSEETRPALWVEERPDGGAQALIVVPLAAFLDQEARAAELVEGWDRSWSVLTSLPAPYREAARRELVDEVALALLVSALAAIADPDGSAKTIIAP